MKTKLKKKKVPVKRTKKNKSTAKSKKILTKHKRTEKSINLEKELLIRLSDTSNPVKISAKNKNKLRLAASKASQWGRCSGYLDLEKNENPLNNFYNAEFGQAIHSLAEMLFLGEYPVFNRYTYDEVKQFIDGNIENLNAIQSAALSSAKDKDISDVYDWVFFYYNSIQTDIEYSRENKLYDDLKIDVFVEYNHTYEGSKYILAATADIVVVETSKKHNHFHLTIYDAKFGRSEIIAEGNLQLVTGAHLIAHKFEVEKMYPDLHAPEMTGVIIQPPLKQKLSTSIVFDSKFLEKIYIEPEKRKFKTGNQCRYCDYNDVCPTFKKQVKKYLNPTFQDETINRVESWAELLSMRGPVKKMLDRVNSSALDYALGGVNIKGYHVANKNGNRTWQQETDLKLVQKVLKLKKNEVINPEKLISPPQIEKVLKADGRAKDMALLEGICYNPIIPYLRKDKEE